MVAIPEFNTLGGVLTYIRTNREDMKQRPLQQVGKQASRNVHKCEAALNSPRQFNVSGCGRDCSRIRMAFKEVNETIICRRETPVAKPEG